MLNRNRNAQLYAEGTSARKRRRDVRLASMSLARRGSLRASAAFALLAAVIFPTPAIANRQSEILRSRAADELYSLDRERAIETFQQAVAADPQDPGAYRGLASAYWMAITFKRGNMTIDDYLDGVTRSRRSPTPPPAEMAAAFNA